MRERGTWLFWRAAVTSSPAIEFLEEITGDLRAAVVVAPGGVLAGSTGLDEPDAAELARRAADLHERASAAGGAEVEQVEVTVPDGGVFMVARDGWKVVALGSRLALSSLAFCDLRHALGLAVR